MVKKLTCLFLIMVFILTIGINIFAATVGQQLTSPETGWQRFDESNSKISYPSDFENHPYTSHYNGTLKSGYGASEDIRICFVGSKIRLLGYRNNGQSSTLEVKIDGVSITTTASLYTTSADFQILFFEKTDLANSIHNVEIINLNTSMAYNLDAIDIDDTGALLDANAPDAPTSLNAISSDAKVDLSWTAVSDATSYNIKRSTTAGGPYTIVTTTAATYLTDNTVTNSTAYYYVVSAVNNYGESSNSNEVSATPAAPEEPPIIGGNKAIIEITLSNGYEKEYDLTSAELQDYLTWYDERSSGTGKAYYTFIKKSNIKPFLSRKEYIAFDKIQSFEVKDYNE